MILVTLAYMERWTYVRTVDGVMAIKPKILVSMGYHIFLTVVLRAHRRLAHSSATTRGNCKKNYYRSLHNDKRKEPMQSSLSHDATIFTSHGTPPADENRSIQGRDDAKTQIIKHFLGICAGLKVNIRDSGGRFTDLLPMLIKFWLKQEPFIQISCKTAWNIWSSKAADNELRWRTKESGSEDNWKRLHSQEVLQQR